MQLYLVAGDTFNLPIQLYDEDTDLPVEITEDIEVQSSIALMSGQVVSTVLASCTVAPMAEVGYLMLSVDSLITKEFPTGKAIIDFKVLMDGQIKHSDRIGFEIIKGATP